MEVYEQPLYYEIAFGFIDPKEQIDNFEKLIKEFSKREVHRFLDIACGPSLQLREIARRGYEAIGLDSSLQMLQYLQMKAKEDGLEIETVLADMSDFRLRKKVDFAFVMMGSIEVESNEKFLSHLDSVAASLNRGGLYFIQNKILDWAPGGESWTMERDGIIVKTTFEMNLKDILSQIYTEKMTLQVDDHGERKNFIHEEYLKFIFPQEFKMLIDVNGKFEFLGWWKGNSNTWHLDQPLEKAKKLDDNMVLLRRK